MNLIKLCIFILVIKILNVALGTLRTIIIIKEKNLIAGIIGFIEVFIWFEVVKEALNTSENNIFIALSYSLGSAMGTFVGGKLSKKYLNQNLTVQIVTEKIIADILRKNGYGVTIINAMENDKKKYLLLIEIKSKDFNQLKNIIKKLDNNAFVFINETKIVINGYFKN